MNSSPSLMLYAHHKMTMNGLDFVIALLWKMRVFELELSNEVTLDAHNGNKTVL